VLVAVGEVRAGDARRRAFAAQVVLDPDLPLLRAEAARDPVELGVALDARVMSREVPGLTREVLPGHVLELRALLDEDLGGGRRVRLEIRRGRRVLLDQRELRALPGDDEQAPEERAARNGIRDANVERLLEYDVLRHVDEEAVPPERRVVCGELLVPADERVEPRLR